MNPFVVEFRYYNNSEQAVVKSFESAEEMNQFLLFMPYELKQDAEVFVRVSGTQHLMEDYLYTLLK